MKKDFADKRIIKLICLLMTVGILCIIPRLDVQATVDGAVTGETETRTYIDEPGSAESGEDLLDINIANSLTIQQTGDNGQVNGSLRILITLTMISLAPILLIMLTSFTRIVIVLHFTRAALNTQSAPPNQVLMGLALFLTFFIMKPYMTEIYHEAVIPLEEGTITQEEFFERGAEPLRQFMYTQAQTKDVRLFLDISGDQWESGSLEDIPLSVLVPAFIIGELREASSVWLCRCKS